MHPETLDYFDIKISVFLCISSSLYVFLSLSLFHFPFYLSILSFMYLSRSIYLVTHLVFSQYLAIFWSIDLSLHLFINSFHSSIIYKPLLSIYQSSYLSISLFLHFLILSYFYKSLQLRLYSIYLFTYLTLHQTRVTTYVLSKTADCHQYLNQVLTVWLATFTTCLILMNYSKQGETTL